MEFERAAALLEGIQRAPLLSVAAPVPAEDLVEAQRHGALPQSRVRAARSWLHALGYLSRDEDRADYDLGLEVAVRAFQKDAGIGVDGWIGEAETWPRLQELVAFEQKLDLDFWTLPNRQPKPALKRAVRARLALYGFDKNRGVLDDIPLMRDVIEFFSALDLLGAAPFGFPRSPAERIARVLDHDRHLTAIAEGAEMTRVRDLLSNPERDRETAGRAFGLMLNVAKIELWLAQGSEADLAVTHRGRVGFGGFLAIPTAIRRDMAQYMTWVDEEVPGVSGLRSAYKRAVRADDSRGAVVMFLQTAAQVGQVDDPMAEDRIEQLHVFYGADENNVPRRAQATADKLAEPRSLRSRLWDGIRRIWSWLALALRKALATGKRVLKLAADLASYAFQVATQGLRQVTRALGSFFDHAEVAVRRTNHDPKRLVWVNREFGRDVNVVASDEATSAYVGTYVAQLAVSAQIFRRACNVLGRAIGLGIRVAGSVISGPLVLRALISAVRDFRTTVSLFGEIVSLQSRHDALQEKLARL
jgi:hypothetical protein